MSHIDVFFPEWQGYGETDSVKKGAEAARKCLFDYEFLEIDVTEYQPLLRTNNILGFHQQIDNLDRFKKLIDLHVPESIFLLGGTCSSELAPVSYLNKKYGGELAILWFDAHGDLNTPESSPSKHFHGMPLRALTGEGDPEIVTRLYSTLLPDQIYLVGVRDLDPGEREFIRNKEIILIPPDEVEVSDYCDLIRQKYVYVHFDCDVLDPLEFPHQLIRVPKGISRGSAKQITGLLQKEFTVVGSSLLEYVPVRQGDLQLMRTLASLLMPSHPL